MKPILENFAKKMNSTHNEGKFVGAERFIRTPEKMKFLNTGYQLQECVYW